MKYEYKVIQCPPGWSEAVEEEWELYKIFKHPEKEFWLYLVFTRDVED